MNNQAEPIALSEVEVETVTKPQAVEAVEIPCALWYDTETNRISIGCSAHDLEDFLEKILEEAHDHD